MPETNTSRDPDAQPDLDDEMPIVATLAENRLGVPGKRIDLRFAGGFMAFREGDGVITLTPPQCPRQKRVIGWLSIL